eukprot:GHVL01004141.1.p1 GENE.GHVL01004141.1~~GHVL01004141.1.p1  ORF type:complete len:386 (-),score=65.40 GHVL01004141.1:73-1230(-)
MARSLMSMNAPKNGLVDVLYLFIIAGDGPKPGLFISDDVSAVLQLPKNCDENCNISELVGQLSPILNETWFLKEQSINLPTHCVFNFWLASQSSSQRIGWDFKNVHKKYLQSFFQRLAWLVDFSSSSQVVYEARLEVNNTSIPTKLLEEWQVPDVLANGTFAPPTEINFVAFWPDNDMKTTAFAVEGWGVVSVLPEKEQTDEKVAELPNENAKISAAVWITHLRLMMGLGVSSWNNTSSTINVIVEEASQGVAVWEILRVGRSMLLNSYYDAVSNLESSRKVIVSLSDLVIEDRIRLAMESSFKNLHAAIQNCSTSSLGEGLKMVRKAHKNSLEILHDSSMMADTYFSSEFKFAVYLPLLLPFIIPLIMEVIASIKRRKTRVKSD